MIQKRTIGVIGVGNVGMAAAYALFLNRTAEEIILVDKDVRRAEGEAMDMMHGQAYVGHIAVRAGGYADLAAAQIVMIAAGRFRALLGKYYQVDPRSVHAYIVGEHGDSEVPLWSKALIGGIPIMDDRVLGQRFDADRMHHVFRQVRDAANDIIARKGYTNTAIGAVLTRLSEAVLEDQKSILTVSTAMTGEYGLNHVCLSIPCVIGFQGIEAKLTPDLTEEELHGIQASARRLKQNIDKIHWNRNRDVP